jgi:hypothetical protein
MFYQTVAHAHLQIYVSPSSFEPMHLSNQADNATNDDLHQNTTTKPSATSSINRPSSATNAMRRAWA